MNRRVRLVRRLVAEFSAALVVSALGMTPATASATGSPAAVGGRAGAQGVGRVVPVPVTGSGRDTEIVIHSADAPSSYRFSTKVPPGGRLRAVGSGPAGRETTADILVEDADGRVVGAYDGAWALDAATRPVKSSFRVEGNTLVQTVRLKRGTAFPVFLGLIYSEVSTSAAPPSETVAGTPAGTAPGVAAGGLASAFVAVPSDYNYNPALGSLHDYCTKAPDEFPAPGAPNADFRGPCARHDLCYAGTTSEFTCDNRLRSDMYTNCNYQYGTFNPLRYACRDTADLYWAVLVVAT